MSDLVRGYVISRGLRTGFLLLGITLFAVMLGVYLPESLKWLFIPTVVVALIYIFKTIKSTALSFFMVSLLTLILFRVPLVSYVEALYGQAQSRTVFMIVLFGGALALVSRQDLLAELDRRREYSKGNQSAQGNDTVSPEEAHLRQEMHVFCLLRRFYYWVEQTFSSPILRCMSLFPLALVNFVSSSTAVLFFKSLWVPTHTDFVTEEDDRMIAAGILCMCVSGVLVLLMSPWWLFFKSTAGAKYSFPKLPIGVLLYGIVSYLHGFWLIFVRSSKTSTAAPSQKGSSDAQTRRMKGLYIVLLCFCALSVSSAVVAAWKPIPDVSGKTLEPSDIISIKVCAVFLGLILSLLLAQSIMYVFYLRPTDQSWRPATFWSLMVGGMRDVFLTVLTLVMILAFKDILVNILKDPNQPGFVEIIKTPHLPDLTGIIKNLLNSAGPIKNAIYSVGSSQLVQAWWQPAFFLFSLGLCGIIGIIIGSSWGTFAIGVLLLDIAHVNKGGDWVSTVIEALIIVVTFINQRSPNADNVQMMLGADKCNAEAVRSVWSVHTFRDHPRLKAEYVQYAIMGSSILIAMILRWNFRGMF